LAPTDPPPNADREPVSPPLPLQRPPARPGRGGPALSVRLRQAHATLAPLVLAPMLITVASGVAYRLLRDWGGWGRDQAHGLMVIHEGEWLKAWLGSEAETLYVLLNGLGLLWMLISGGTLVLQRWRQGHRPGRPGDLGGPVEAGPPAGLDGSA